jgi:fumarate reductase flavoprotein subunit
MELGPRDRVSQAIVGEMQKGRTIDTPYGPVVHLDLRHLGAKLIDTKLPFVRELCLKYERIDPVKEMIPVRPVVHYMMGGVHTDINGATPIQGLYAAGETACVSINGANRLGSNSLPETLVFGARAGRAAAAYVQSLGDASASTRAAVTAQADDEVRRLRSDLMGRDGSQKVPELREQMHHTMEGAAGIYRNGPDIAAGSQRLAELRERMAKVGVADSSRAFNTELTAALELANMMDIAESMLISAGRREESRGAHQRTDFPKRDDEQFLMHQMVHRNDAGELRIERLPVTITRWPPGERVYGR